MALMFCLMLVVSAAGQMIGASLSQTFTNPTPTVAMGENLGFRLVALGSERVLITAPNDTLSWGAAYLYHANGALLNIITNPNPAAPGFGLSAAVIGTDKFLFGSPFDDTGTVNAGAAYLISTNGTLLLTLTNPTPDAAFSSEEQFGTTVAALGSDRLLVTARDGNILYPQKGAVYLYSTNGTLLNTITNPIPTSFSGGFGAGARAVGEDKLFIGAPGAWVQGVQSVGLAYLYDTNGTLITTFTNPSPAEGDNFGVSSAALSADRVIIGARDSGAAGAVFLFHTNGTLLQTFVSPDPAPNELFGSALATLGDLVIIGAYQDTPPFEFQTGTTYIFKTNGILLRRILNPRFLSSDDQFGIALASAGTNQLYIGADRASTGDTRAGAAYRYTVNLLPSPALQIDRPDAASVRVFWSFHANGFLLEQCTALPFAPDTNSWNLVPPPYAQIGFFSNGVLYAFRAATFTTTNHQFFRLRQP
jgi:hypothetical protein